MAGTSFLRTWPATVTSRNRLFADQQGRSTRPGKCGVSEGTRRVLRHRPGMGRLVSGATSWGIIEMYKSASYFRMFFPGPAA